MTEIHEVNMPGYSLVRCDSNSRFTGDVAMYIRNDIRFETILTRKIEPSCWTTVIEVKEKWYKGVIMVVYHSPSASDADFLSFLVDRVEDLIIKRECIVVGDFNIDLMVNSFYAKKLQTTMNSMEMKQHVNKPTKITKQSRSILDLVFSNKEIEVSVMYDHMIIDHACLKIEQKKDRTDSKYRKYTARDYSEFVDRFVEILQNGLEHNKNSNVSERAGRLVDNMVQALNMVGLKKQVEIPRTWHGKRWFNDEIRKAAKRRDEAYTKAIYEDMELSWIHYKRERNTVVKLIRIMKKKYYEKIIDRNKGNPTAMWKTSKEIIRGEPGSDMKAEDINFENLNNAGERNIADNFNLFYIQSIDNIIKSIKSINEVPEDSRENANAHNEDMVVLQHFDTVSIEEVEGIVRRLSRKKGMDEGISTDIMKTAWNVIKNEYVDIINSSLKEGICPESWEMSTIKPIPRIEQPKKASQFRLINMLPTFEKILELVVKKQLEKYLESNKYVHNRTSIGLQEWILV